MVGQSNMILIPGGTFEMGIPADQIEQLQRDYHISFAGLFTTEVPRHTVQLDAFYIDPYPVTNAEFKAFLDAQPAWQPDHIPAHFHNGDYLKHWTDDIYPPGKADHPVVYVSWYAAVAYAQWIGKRLPTEAEWEKAARGDDGRAYPWGNDFVAENGNFYEGGIRGTTAVGSFPAGASPYGVEDMAGNVREWTADDFVAYPGAAADADPFFGQGNKVNRGGGWFDGEDGEIVTTYNRNAGPPSTSANDDIGFRCARDAG